ncbi:HAD-IA family hydrolase [Actinophytocola sp.]|uniref:HAD-IA family hydrolase n=1 Tax=Actinophytocola sp. TaxID=1872138 RepID=UPI002ED14765
MLFDMDGTLLDSAECVRRVWSDWGDGHGFDVDELMGLSHGRRNDEVVRLVAPWLDVAGELARLASAEEDCRDGIAAVPGARRLLAQLGAARWAVVTSAWRRLARIRLGAAGLELPPVLVTADDVERGKPDPEGYLQAAARLGCRPTACVVVEDAPAGVAAARAAGMRVVGVTTTVGRDRLGCEWCVEDLRALTARVVGGDPAVVPGRAH